MNALLRGAGRCTLYFGFVMIFVVLPFFSDAGWCSLPVKRMEPPDTISILNNHADSTGALLTADKKNRDRSESEWESLSPREKENMRRKWNRLNKKPEQDRQEIQHLYRKWQKLSPSERNQIQRELDNMNDLSPQEREKIRRRFRD